MTLDPNALLVASGLTKTFQRKGSPQIDVLRRLDLTVYPGEKYMAHSNTELRMRHESAELPWVRPPLYRINIRLK